MRRWLLLALAALLAWPAPAVAAYDPAGVYLDAPAWPDIATRDDVRLDAAGIPQVRRDGRYVYNPVTISQYGLQEWSRSRLETARRAADWLVANQEAQPGAWRYGYAFPVGGMGVTLGAGWISAMAQGQAMSLLTRVWRRTADARYLSAADAALGPFRAPVADGGVVAGFLSDAGPPFFEEYPTQPASLTLNGFMFGLLGLYDLSTVAPATDAGALYAAGRETLGQALPYFDTGGVSAYHLGHLTNPPRPVHASLKYHRIHVVELDALVSLGADPVLERYRDRWAAYRPPAPRRVVAARAPPPEPLVVRLVRRPRPGARRLAVAFTISRPATVTLTLARRARIGGRWRVHAARMAPVAEGGQTLRLRRRLRSGVYRARVSAGAAAAALRFRVGATARGNRWPRPAAATNIGPVTVRIDVRV